MSETKLSVYFDNNRRAFQPGDTLRGEFQIETPPPDLKAAEVTVLWFTEGKGDEDFAVHQFERRELDTIPAQELRQPQRFEARLPASPLSYEGAILRIRWCVRVRLFLPRREVLVEEGFRLGRVPAARLPAPTLRKEPDV